MKLTKEATQVLQYLRDADLAERVNRHMSNSQLSLEPKQAPHMEGRLTPEFRRAQSKKCDPWKLYRL